MAARLTPRAADASPFGSAPLTHPLGPPTTASRERLTSNITIIEERAPMRQPIWIKVILTLFILVASGAAGVWLGSAITPNVATAAHRIKWTPLRKPPEAAAMIIGNFVCDRSLGVVVQSLSGNRYISCPSGWQPWNNMSSEPWQLLACAGDPPTSYSPDFDSLPHAVKDCKLTYTIEWELSQEVYVILDDGSVWQWVFTYGLGTMIGYWINGLLLGLVVGIILSIQVWRKGKYSSATQDLPDEASSI